VGQKIHPKFFRLGISQNHLSTWYSTKLEYKQYIKEDYLIRKKINQILNDILIISQISISRTLNKDIKNNEIYIIISGQLIKHSFILKKITEFFNFEIEKIEKLMDLKIEDLIKIISIFVKYKLRNLIRILQYIYKKKIYISIKFLKNCFEDPTLFAKHIGIKLQKRIPFRRILKDAFEKTRFNSNIKGLKIQISGRLNGQDIARTEWKREGKIPLHTLNIKIDYAFVSVETIYGLMGIKIWLYKEE